jgi:hypothetical protein
MSALPEEVEKAQPRLRLAHERAMKAGRELQEALEEMRLLLAVEESLQDEEVLEGLRDFADHVKSGEAFEDGYESVSEIRSRPT